MTEDQKIDAGALSVALAQGHADLPEVIAWAHAQIAIADNPGSALIDLSLSNNVADAIGLLNSLAANPNVWRVNFAFLRRFRSVNSMSVSKAMGLSEYLYFLAIDPTAPEPFKPFMSHWDAIGLAQNGVYGVPRTCVDDFLQDLRRASNATYPVCK